MLVFIWYLRNRLSFTINDKKLFYFFFIPLKKIHLLKMLKFLQFCKTNFTKLHFILKRVFKYFFFEFEMRIVVLNPFKWIIVGYIKSENWEEVEWICRTQVCWRSMKIDEHCDSIMDRLLCIHLSHFLIVMLPKRYPKRK